jgi:hypothetical protein
MPTDETASASAPANVTARRIGFVALAVVLTGAVIAGVVFAVNVIGLAGWRGGAPEDTTRVLRSAAAAADRTPDPVVADGQYRRITLHAITLTSADDGDHQYSWIDETTEHTYVPADPAGDWVWTRPLPKPLEGLSDGALEYATASYEDTISRSPDGDGTLQAPGGAFYGYPTEWGPEQLATLPDDPRELLNELYRILPETAAGLDATAFGFLADRLVAGFATSHQRAVYFRALVLIPGTKTAAAHATWGDRTGVVVERDEGAVIDQLLVDPEQGAALAQRRVTTKADGTTPAGTNVSWNATTVDVVDHAPSGGTVCGTGTGMTFVDGSCIGGN